MDQRSGPPIFLITSAIGTRFGAFTREQRLSQTVATVESVRQRVADAKLVLVEMGGETPGEAAQQTLRKLVDVYIDFTQDQNVRRLYAGTDNWDVVKNATEMLCFGHALKMLRQRELLRGTSRVFKLSGRYQLTDEFDPDFYARPEIAGKIVLKHKMRSQFPIELTQVPLQYMSRLWSFPSELAEEIAATYDKMLQYMFERVKAGGYVDVEHCLYKFMDPQKIVEVETVGVAGVLGANARPVRD